jgi:hypothetical protein
MVQAAATVDATSHGVLRSEHGGPPWRVMALMRCVRNQISCSPLRTSVMCILAASVR